MSDQPYFSIHPDYIVLSRAEYDEIVEQRVLNRIDHAERMSELETDSMKWHNQYLDECIRAGKAIKERDEARQRENDLAFKLHEANDTIIQLRAEICILNEELCRSDEIEEIKPVHDSWSNVKPAHIDVEGAREQGIYL